MKKRKDTEFDRYRQTLTETQAQSLQEFFGEFDSHTVLSRKEKARLRADFENAIYYFASAGVPLTQALSRLSIENLGGFYARPPILWYPLDDAAKIYPLSMRHGQMAVFRISMYLKQPVVPEILQMALIFTIKRFPSFATTLKNGFFWHYLDTAKNGFRVEKETEIPCKPLTVSKTGSPTFRVLYYQNRISAEFFHVLTDGTGGMIFIKTLTAEYLRLLGAQFEKGEGVLDTNETPSAAEFANAFVKAEKTGKSSGFFGKPAVQMSGRLTRRKPCRVLHFNIDAVKLKAVTANYHTTVTAYILALMFVAGKAATDELAGDLHIQVPVNMRKYYPAETLRNFSMYCGIKLPLQEISSVASMLEEITRQLGEKATMSAMNEMMNATEDTVRMLRYIPLKLKSSAAKIAYGLFIDKIYSSTLSNMGVVQMPKALSAHIDHMDFVLGTAITNRVSCAMVTFGNTATLSVSKQTDDPSFEEAMNRLLLADGIEADITGSAFYEN